ncbi:MAG TPA: DNA translocase FtsK 4TM domain-containing protein, partial [Terriglobales bacterium]|nr:DNA translocase FtsK 4TM domain-containing protein [Terriglobales bacterium]
MKYFSLLFTPTKNRRLNELVGFLVFIFAILLLLALASYSPLDPSLNTAASPAASNPARNWVGMVGAYGSDLLLQLLGITIFFVPGMLWLLATRWFRSRPVDSPLAKSLGALALLVFVPALLGLLPWHLRWRHALPIEGLLGRIVSDALLHYLNLVGAYLVCAGAIAIALYLATAFSFGAVHLWLETRFAFVFAAWDRFQDWRMARAKAQAERQAAKRKAAAVSRSTVTTQLLPARRVGQKTGIERLQEEQMEAAPAAYPPPAPAAAPAPARGAASTPAPEVGARADNGAKSKTTMPKIAGGYKLPSSSLLHRPDEQRAVNEEDLKSLAQVLVEKLAEFEVYGQVTHINPGPVVTTFEFKPDAGIKYSRVTGLSDDLCLALRAESILIERMAGKSTVGIQVPNRERETIWLREIIESQEFAGSKSRLTLAMGKDINGRIVTAELGAMPHLLIAGSTGAGKSVAINSMIISMLYKANPDQVRLILVDPKRLELGVYEGLPHLYTPIITEPKLASYALRNAVREMERRLKLLAEQGVRHIDQYNRLFEEERTPSLFENNEAARPLPYIIIIIDELADLMMIDQNNVEESITRLAQMARAVGIHLILATQRPSVDVITGLIKANFPARVSFRVATKVDSRTILDANGAEALLGRGDMLYLPSGSARVHRVHAPLVTEKEIGGVVEFWRAQGQAQYEHKF